MSRAQVNGGRSPRSTGARLARIKASACGTSKAAIYSVAGVAHLLKLSWPAISDYQRRGSLKSSVELVGADGAKRPAFTRDDVVAFRTWLLARWRALAETGDRERYESLVRELESIEV